MQSNKLSKKEIVVAVIVIIAMTMAVYFFGSVCTGDYEGSPNARCEKINK